MFVVEGYNQKDYISGIFNWETLFVSDNAKEVDSYVMNIPEGYVIRIEERDDLFFEDLANTHWEIYTGV
jgi:hypothetical protein